jgi:hypothetical protein
MPHDSGRHASTAAAIELACRLTGWTPRAIGDYDGGISGAAVSVARRKIRAATAGETIAAERLLAKLAKKAASGH